MTLFSKVIKSDLKIIISVCLSESVSHYHIGSFINDVIFEKLIHLVGGDGVDPGVGVVHQQVELAFLLALDPLEERLNFRVIGMINLNRDRGSTAGTNLLGTVIKHILCPASNINLDLEL